MDYLRFPDNTLISIEEMKNYTDDQLVLITTGSQVNQWQHFQEWLHRNSQKGTENRGGDTIVFSPTITPGNEKANKRLLMNLYMKGAIKSFLMKLTFQDMRVRKKLS